MAVCQRGAKAAKEREVFPDDAFTTMETKSQGLQGIADAKRESDRQYAKLLAGTR